MKRILVIFRKDARHLWPQILAFLALVVLAALLDPTYMGRKLSAAEEWIWTALPVACWYLVIAAIHTERLPGDRQYWLTRPFSRAELLSAKALFAVAFVNLPVLVTQAGVFAALGIPPLQHAATLFWRQVFFSAFLVLPAAALGAVTRNLKQAILAALMVAVPVFLVVIAPFIIRMGVQSSLLLIQIWSGDQWMRTVYLAACALIASAAILALQYWRRATILARTVLAAALVLCCVAAATETPQQAVALQRWLSPARSDTGAVRISYGQDVATAYLRSNGRRGFRVRLEIPVRLDGVPRGMEYVSVGLAAVLQGAPVGGELTGSPAAPILAVYLERGAFEHWNSGPADLRGSVDLVLFDRTQTLPIPGTDPVAVRGLGACSARPDADGRLSVLCFTPFPRAALSLQFPGGGRLWIVTPRDATVPLPTSVGFQPIDRFVSPVSFEDRQELDRLRLVAERPVATIRREFDLKGIRLPGNWIR